MFRSQLKGGFPCWCGETKELKHLGGQQVVFYMNNLGGWVRHGFWGCFDVKPDGTLGSLKNVSK